LVPTLRAAHAFDATRILQLEQNEFEELFWQFFPGDIPNGVNFAAYWGGVDAHQVAGPGCFGIKNLPLDRRFVDDKPSVQTVFYHLGCRCRQTGPGEVGPDAYIATQRRNRLWQLNNTARFG
jgi:hypothetical protein